MNEWTLKSAAALVGLAAMASPGLGVRAAVAQGAAKPAQTAPDAAPTQPAPAQGGGKEPYGGLGKEGMDLKEREEATKPGPVHQSLAKRAGEYTTTTRYFMKPGDPPAETKGTARITLALDGRFIQEENTGEMMGQPYRGMRLTGYNIGAKKYEACWTYTQSTGMLLMTGVSDDGGKSIRWTGAYDDEMGSRQALHAVTKFIDDDRFVVQMFGGSPSTKETVVLETEYVRKK